MQSNGSKKMMAAVLSLAMAVSMGIPAVAATPDPTAGGASGGNLTIMMLFAVGMMAAFWIRKRK